MGQEPKEAAMKTTMKAVLGAALLGAAAFATAPAEARGHVSVGIGIGVPGPVYGPVYADPCYGPYPYPYYCRYPVYAEPVFYGGVWYNHPRFRVIGGRRVLFVGGGWHHVHAGHHHR